MDGTTIGETLGMMKRHLKHRQDRLQTFHPKVLLQGDPITKMGGRTAGRINLREIPLRREMEKTADLNFPVKREFLFESAKNRYRFFFT